MADELEKKEKKSSWKRKQTEIAKTRNDVALLIQALINLSKDDLEFREARGEGHDSFRSSDEGYQGDVIFRNTVTLEDVNRSQGRATGGDHWIQQKHMACRDVTGQVLVHQARLSCLFIALNEDFANVSRPQNRPQCLLPGDACEIE